MQEPLMEEEYSVQLPADRAVYYDTLKEETMTVQNLDMQDGFVTYAIDGERENIHTDDMQTFLAWLAAGRFVQLGRREETGEVLSTDEQVADVFRQAFDVDPREHDPLDIARYLLSRETDDTVVRGDR